MVHNEKRNNEVATYINPYSCCLTGASQCMSQLSEQENTHLYIYFFNMWFLLWFFFVCLSVYLAEEERERERIEWESIVKQRKRERLTHEHMCGVIYNYYLSIHIYSYIGSSMMVMTTMSTTTSWPRRRII
jgi:hypothetical protein